MPEKMMLIPAPPDPETCKGCLSSNSDGFCMRQRDPRDGTYLYTAGLRDGDCFEAEAKALDLHQKAPSDTSDGYHTFDELYEHRHALFGLVCAAYNGWKARKHSDDTMFDGWFIAGCLVGGKQITYHLPMRLWDSFPARELVLSPEWDGHTAADVVERVKAAWSIDPLAELREAVYEVNEHCDCGDNSCRFARDFGGIRTNGSCQCIGPGHPTPEVGASLTALVKAARKLV